MTVLAEEWFRATRRSSVLDQATGIVNESITETFRIRGNVQPPSGRTLQILPERGRVTGSLLGFFPASQRALRVQGGIADATLPDTLLRESTGRRYEVHAAQGFEHHRAGVAHRAYLLVEIGKDEPQ